MKSVFWKIVSEKYMFFWKIFPKIYIISETICQYFLQC